MDKSLKVIGIGSPVVDLLSNVNDDFLKANIDGDKGGMILVSEEEMNKILSCLPGDTVKAPGGSAGNTIFAMCELGINGAMIGKVGDDENGKFYVQSLESAGGDISGFRKDPSSPTAVSICMVTEDAERTMRTNLGAAMNLSPEELSADDFKGYPLLHIEGYLAFNEALIKGAVKCAKDAGCKVSMDLASFEVVHASKPFLSDLLKDYVDIVFANEDETKAFSGSDDMEAGLDLLSSYCEIAVVKTGSKGSMVKQNGKTFKIEPVLCEKAVDTTGAGDYFAAGFLYGYLKGFDMEKCGAVGSKLGSEVVSVLGAKIDKNAWNGVKEYLADLNLL